MNNKDIAVIGMACKFPKSNDLDEFWKNLCEGKDCISRKGTIKEGNKINAFGAIDRPFDFDNEFFNISNNIAEGLAPQQRLAMKLVYCTMEDAGYNAFNNEHVVGIICGEAENEYHYERMKYFEKNEPELMMAERLNTGASLTSRVAFEFNLKGPCMTIDTACSTSLSAVHIACNMLRCNEADMMLAGGVCILLDQNSYSPFENVMSSDGYTKAYDKDGTGFVPGNGGGIVLLKRLEDAERDNDHIYAVIKGSAMNNDGSDKVGYSAPAVQGHVDVIKKALSNADLTAECIDCLEGHGTATVLGDAVEIRAFKKIFKNVSNKEIYIGSLKSNFGHLNSAAGIASFIKSANALDKKIIPPTINVNEVNPELGNRTCLKVLKDCKKLDAKNEKYHIGVSSVGIGGSNAHLILEEYNKASDNNDYRDIALLLLSNKDKDKLNEYEKILVNYLNNSDLNINDVAYTLACHRKFFENRKFLVYDKGKLLYDSPEFDTINSSACQKIMLFAGTGSVYEGLGTELYKVDQQFRKYYDDCYALFKLDYPDIDLMYDKEEELDCVRVSIAEYALAQYLISLGTKPDVLIGYSMGEYIAAAVAGVLNIRDVLAIVYERAKILNRIQNSVMFLAACSASRFDDLLSDGIYIAGYNASDRCLIVCRDSEYDKFKAYIKERSIFCSELSIKTPAHSKELDVLKNEITQLFDNIEFGDAKYPIASTYYGRFVNENELSNKEYWIEQMMNPVRFTDAIADVYKKYPGFKYFIHIGADAGLTNYVRRDHLNECDVVEFLAYEMEERRFFEGIGKLWGLGVDISICELFSYRPGNIVHLPPYAFNEKEIKSLKLLNDDFENTSIKNEESVMTISNFEKDDLSNSVIEIIKNVIDTKEISIDDEVSALGIDSLAVLIVQTKLQAAFNCELSIKDLYGCNRISDLVELVRQSIVEEGEQPYAVDEVEDVKDLSELFNL